MSIYVKDTKIEIRTERGQFGITDQTFHNLQTLKEEELMGL